VTAISGRVLRLDGRPLPDVSLEVEGDAETRSDRTGRFLLVLRSATTARRVLRIDGAPASRGTRRYGFFEYGLTVTAGSTNVLPFTVWLPKLDVAHQVRIASPTAGEVVVRTPYIPGLELHLPAGTTITGEDGTAVTTLTLTPIPVDRPPFPLAANVEVPVYFTIQPGGAYVHTASTGPKGAWLVYPNYRQGAPGQRVQFFHYDPDVKGWYVYGLGRVSGDASQVKPDPTTRFYSFTGAMINVPGSSPPDNGETPDGPDRGDPVDPSTGVFILHNTDLYLPDRIPLVLRRAYNSGDNFARPFGRGMTHPYAMFLWSARQYEQADLILPEGGKIHYVRTSAGTSWTDAEFLHVERPGDTPPTPATPTPFYKSTIVWNGRGWDLTLKDGTVYVFGENTPLQAIRDRFGNTVTITHATGQGGNITQVTSPSGRFIRFTYDGSNRLTQATDNIDRTVQYTYDQATGNLQTVTDPENHVTTYTWDATNRLATIKDGRNIVYLTNHYDANGRVDRQTLADPDASYTYAYTTDSNGNVTQTDITNPRGYTERLTFNSNHYLLTDVQALGQPEERTMTYERLPNSNFPTAIIDGLNRRTEYTYDEFGHVKTVKRLAGTADAVTTTYSYEPLFFQLAKITDPLLHDWTVGYDANGRMTGVTDPLTHRTTVTMNAMGQVTSVGDPLQHTWQFGYTGGDQTSATNPVGSVWRTVTDAAGRILWTTDPLGRITQSVIDKVDRVQSITDPMSGQTQIGYDPNGRVLSLSDALSHSTNYTYDASDRLETRRDALQNVASYGYDKDNNLTSVTDRKNQVTNYQYDALNRPILATYADLSTTRYVYDAGNRLRQVIDSTAGTITRDFDGLDRLTSETTPEGSIGYTYDADGRRASMTVAGQPQAIYGYDDANRLTSVTQGTNIVLMTYDDADRRQTVTLPNGIVVTYGYDDASQLVSLAYARTGTTLGTLTYTYDAIGNRTGVGGGWARTALPAALASATYDPSNRIQAWAGQNYGYDLNGNLENDGFTSYAWNSRNQMGGFTGGVSASFAYDGVGRRRAKTIAGGTTRFLYDGLNIVQEQAADGTPTANLLTGLGIDETFTRTDGAGLRVLLVDVLGSTVELADASGNLETHYTFGPFGATTSSGATSTNAQQFTARENDGELYNYRARYYSPLLARFVAEDPLEFDGGPNLHAYVDCNPVLFTDPLGLESQGRKDETCIEKWMLVTAYSNTGPGSDWPHYKPKTPRGRPRGVGPNTVAVANTNPLPYPYGSRVTVFGETPSGDRRTDYQGTVHDTGAGWDPKHHNVDPDEWIDVWLPRREAKKWGKQWRLVKICW
jgi:RHS repeat-associated protein